VSDKIAFHTVLWHCLNYIFQRQRYI